MAAGMHEAGFPAAARRLKAGVPAVTVLAVAAGLALALLPDAAALLVYDRERVLGGEVWRLASGHAVHFSWTHAAWNLALFSVAGGWLERAHRARYLWLLALTAPASGLYFLIALPEMARYGGLSGLVSAAVVSLCLSEIRRGGPARAIWAAILLLFAAKVGYEILAGRALFATPDAIPFQVAPAAHIIGAAVAVMQFLIVVRRRPGTQVCAARARTAAAGGRLRQSSRRVGSAKVVS